MNIKSKKWVDSIINRLRILRRAGIAIERVWLKAKRHLTHKHLFVGSGVAVLLLIGGHAAYFLWPRPLTFSYSAENCFTNPTLLPRMMGKKKSASYDVTLDSTISAANYPLYSHTTCVHMTKPPIEKTTEIVLLAPWGNPLLKKHIRVPPGVLPALPHQAQLNKPVATKNPLVLSLDQQDNVFAYRLLVENREAPCAKQGRLLRCEVAKLQLAQSAKYHFTLQRLFKGRSVNTLFARELPTVEAVQIAHSSIVASQHMYDAPSTLTLELNKDAESLEGGKLYAVVGDQRHELPATTTLAGKIITVRFDQPLPRKASVEFRIEQLTASDGAFLAAPFVLPFSTSGGPTVLGTNIGKTKVQPATSVALTLDTDLAPGQALGNFIRLERGGQNVPAMVTARGRTITITPAAAQPRCAVFTVKVLDGLQNSFGVSGGSAWQFTSRTMCRQTVFSIGTSVLGRSITAYSFGSGPSKIIFLGGTRGNEKSSVYLLNRWVDYLENNPERIPGHRTVVVIPNLNPDGFATGQRTNANNVDLNRNFPTGDWKSGVTMPDGSFNANGGGAHPLSEPESRRWPIMCSAKTRG